MTHQDEKAKAADDLTGYGPAARKLIRDAANCGPLDDVDAVGKASTYHCGGRIEVHLRIDREERVIADVGYVASGCPAVTAALSVATELIRGKRVKDATRLDWCDVLSVVGDVPRESEGCVRTAVVAVREAAYDYLDWASSHVTIPGIPIAMGDFAGR